MDNSQESRASGEMPEQRERERLSEEVQKLQAENARLQKLLQMPVLNSRLAAIVESSDDAVVSKNLDGIILTWNKGAERIFGWKAEEVVGKAINILIPPERQEEEPHILGRIRRGERVDHFETVRMRKDGTRIDVSVTISPVRDAEGKIVAASKIARDVTLQKRYQRELQRAKEEAEAANKAKDQFLSVLSHELRTPLTPALAELSYLEESPDAPEWVREEIAMVRRNVETEARLVDDLLDVTRIARGKLQLRTEVVDLRETIRSVVGMLQSQVDAKKLELSVALRAKHHNVWGDAGRLQQVVMNLLSNAVKFTPDGGQVWVRSMEGADGRVRLEVSDSGVGIEPEMLPRLFMAFEQGTRARMFGGLGLGLSIARSLVELHQGMISAHSAGPGQGATFVVELPVTEEPVARRGGGSARGLLMRRALGFRVLLVEDHPDTREAMSRLLQAIGCEVVVAGSVKEAVEMGNEGQFDLLISDIGLPDGSGTDVMRQLRDRKIRGIALSGFGQEEDLERSKAAGFDAHITKPVNFQQLKEVVGRYTGER